MSLLRAEGIAKEYFNRDVLQDASLTVEDHEIIGLVGENGTGKSTLMKILAGVEPQDSGRVHIASKVIMTYLAQHVDDMVEDNDLTRTVLESPHIERLERRMIELAEAVAEASTDGSSEERVKELSSQYHQATETFQRLDGYSYQARFAQALNGLGIRGELLEQPLNTLSGGERMRVMMARRLLENPDLLLLDEPTNHLDLEGIEWLEDYLIRFKGSALVISHDRYFLDRIADRICEVRAGRIESYPGNYSQYVMLKEEQERFRRQEVTRITEEMEHQQEVLQTAFEHRNFSTYHSREKVVAKLKDQLDEARSLLDPGPQRMSFKFMPRETEHDPSRVIISARELSMAYGERCLFERVAFDIRARDKVVLVGPNGCGKSTLLKILLGGEEDFGGNILLSSTIRYATMNQYVNFEHEDGLVIEELMSRTDLNEGAARNLLARYGFRDIDVFKTIAVLSGGERSRLYLCCLLEEQPDVLFLDEPTNHLDIPSREILEEALRQFEGAILAVSHDRYFIKKCSDWVLGFTGTEIKRYRDYEHYRHQERIYSQEADRRMAEQSAREADARRQARSMQSGQTPASRGLNKAEERRKKAKLQRDMAELEQRIMALEEESEDLQAQMQSAEGSKIFERYATVAATLEDLNAQYYELAEDPLLSSS